MKGDVAFMFERFLEELIQVRWRLVITSAVVLSLIYCLIRY